MASPRPPLLLAFAEGVGPDALTALRLHGEPAGSVVVPLADVPANPIACLLGPFDAVVELRDLGVAVDRSSVLFRAANMPDAAVIAALSGRVTGPADVTVLAFSSVLDAARAGGNAAVPRARIELGALLEAAGDRLRSGERPELWLVGLGDPQPVHTTFDVERHFVARVPAPLSQQLQLLVGEAAATVIGENQRALDLARELLGKPPFRGCGTTVLPRPGALQFVASAGFAFGSTRVAGRAAHRNEATAAVLLPAAARTAARSIDFRGLLARFWMRAATLHGHDESVARGRTAVRSSTTGADLPARLSR